MDRDAHNDLFERAREADIEAVAGTPLFRAGRRLRGECPLCGASQGKKKDGAFSVDPEARVFKCWGCGLGGDVVRLEQEIRGGTPREAAERLVGRPVAPGPRTTLLRARVEPVRGPRPTTPAAKIGQRIWTEGWRAPIGETLGGVYLRHRGISADLVAAVGTRLQFHPEAPWEFDPERKRWVTAPAMVGRVSSPGGLTGGVHVTYLAADGRGKARLTPAKRMWGPQRDEAGRPGGLWLIPPVAGAPTIVSEGIESGLSAAQLHGVACGVVAALSLGALQGEWLADQWGRIDPAAVTADPAKPGFTWPKLDDVTVAVDRDMKPIEIKVRKLGGGTVRRRLDADERARICAGLAIQAWRAAGTNAVRAIAPAAGRDFNDELRERVGA